MKTQLMRNSTWALVICNLLSLGMFGIENNNTNSCLTFVQNDSMTINTPINIRTEHGATFPGGEEELLQFLADNFEFQAMKAEEIKKGFTIVKIHLNKKGKVIKTEFITSLHPLISKEIKRVVKKMPNWIPASENGLEKPSFVLVPIHTH
jgi:hypothetical protein